VTDLLSTCLRTRGHIVFVLLIVVSPRLSVRAIECAPAFPGAVGQGAVSVGGRGGDVYHVVTLKDYDPKKCESALAGSLRYAITSAHGPRTIVFDIGGAIKLHGTLTISRSKLTIAGQTAPGGITLWGYPLQVDGASDVVIRFIRVRTGDFNARAPKGNDSLHGKGAMDLDAPDANGIGVIHSSRIILDHISTAWGMDETLSVTHSRDVTVQHSIVAEGLDRSFHPKGPHGYGSLIRGEITPADQNRGTGGYTLYGNLWALNRARNPSVGGQQTLKPGQSESQRRRADVNIANNVVYGWSDRPTHRNDFGQIRLNFVGNYFVNGPANKSRFIFFDHNPAPTITYQDGNMLDANLNRELDGKIVGLASDIHETFRGIDANDQLFGPPQGKPLNFFKTVAKHVLPADKAYSLVISSVGDSLARDTIDRRIIEYVVSRTGYPIDSQEVYRDAHGVLPGIDDLVVTRRLTGFDSDRDGIPDEFEGRHGLNAHNSRDRNGFNLSKSGYTNLEVYLNGLIQ
jgi:hypothetical protein